MNFTRCIKCPNNRGQWGVIGGGLPCGQSGCTSSAQYTLSSKTEVNIECTVCYGKEYSSIWYKVAYGDNKTEGNALYCPKCGRKL